MKINKILSILFVTITAIVVTSCVKDADFEIPKPEGDSQQIQNELIDSIKTGKIGLITFEELKSNFFVSKKATFIKKDIAIKGYVSSSDEGGNFFKHFYIQDAATNATSGIKVIVNKSAIHTQFNKGREVYIRLKGLYVGESDKSGNNVVTIGGGVRNPNDARLTPIYKKEITKHILRTTVNKTIVPLDVKLSDITEKHIGILLRINNVQFAENEIEKTFVDLNSDFNSERTLQVCNGNNYETFNIETSSFANFSESKLPKGNGYIDAILIKDYDKNMRLAISVINDFEMNGERCKLDGNPNPDKSIVFEDDFATGKFDKWTTKNISGSAVWKFNTYSSNPIKPTAEISGFKKGANEDWLISKAIDLSKKTSAKLVFDNMVKFPSDNELELFIATDYNGGNPNTDGTWTKLNYIKDKDGGKSDYNVSSSGSIDVSSAAGKKLFIAFKYTCTEKKASLYRIDNVKVTAK